MDWLGGLSNPSGTQPLEVLEFGSTTQLPELGKDRHHVLIKVHYADINHAMDAEKLVGARGEKRPDVPNKDLGGASGPNIPGFGGSGVVEACGCDPALVGKPVCFFSPKAGSYASHVVTDVRCLAELPANMDPEPAAAIPVSGLCALQTLGRLGLAKDASVALSNDGTLQKATTGLAAGTQENKTMLIVGASGGVGSWILTLLKAWHPHIYVIATASKENQEWCKSLGANKVLAHHDISSQLEPNSVDYVIGLTEATPQVFGNWTTISRPYGTIALVTQGPGMKSLNLAPCWTKSVTVITHSIMTSPQNQFTPTVPATELQLLVRLLVNQTIKVPMSPDMADEKLSTKFKDALRPDTGLLHRLYRIPQTHPRRGKYVLRITAGDHILFLDFKTGAIVPIARKEVIARKFLTPVKDAAHAAVWKEESKLEERHALIDKMCQSRTLQIVKQAAATATDYQDGLDMQEAENVKNLWGVSLKKREKNKVGEEFAFVDARFASVGELSRKASLGKGIITVGAAAKACQMGAAETAAESSMTEIVLEALEITEEERTELICEIRMGLKIGVSD